MEGFFTFLSPLESLPLLQELVEWSAAVSEFGDKSVKGGQHPGQYLHFFRIARQLEVFHSFNMVGVDLYSLISN